MELQEQKYQMVQIDLGNLMAYDRHHHFPSVPSERGELVKECLQKGTELVQAIADVLFNLPSTEDRDGPIVQLPPPTTRYISMPMYNKMPYTEIGLSSQKE
uniref:Ribosome biogenesis regulatory protein n=1 Tax=Nelumbo nucifera TaxID=4432 RepID=A0A822ZSQ7_NELNU|nr:TPA_asm: hypothetical protein HUJ06_003118 [Nelumbo nucifera]